MSDESPLLDPDANADARPIAASRPFGPRFYPTLVLASFALGILISYLIWGRSLPTPGGSSGVSSDTGGTDAAALMKEVNPPDGYKLPVRYGDLGPRLIRGGVINYAAFAAVYSDGGSPLTPDQVNTLKNGSNAQILITSENAHFLLNFFWAVGLANRNSILTQGPMVQYSQGKIENFASTGGWTLGTKPVTELYASMDLIPLTAEQQSRVEQVASAVYRPCCNNPTLFPDCNHGMAMLGLLELMASQGAGVSEMFTAARYVSAYWFPQQALMTALYLKSNRNIDFAQADPQMVLGKDFFSASGAGRVYASLQSEGLLPKTPDSGGGCGS